MAGILTGGEPAVLHETDMHYREWAAPAAWAPVVRCLWEQRAGAAGHVQRVLPDACADVIVDAGGRAFVVGPATATALPRLEPRAHVRGLRLRPEAVGAVLGLDAGELRDRVLALDDLLAGPRARAVAAALGGEGAAAGAELDAWLRGGRLDRRAAVAVRWLLGSPSARPAAVAEHVGVTPRHLRRLLLAQAGQGPRTLQRVGRLHRFLALAEAREARPTLAEAALAAGYADQPHLGREVRRLSGLTPVRLLAERARAPVT